MRQTLWMVERELRERKLVFAAGLLLGITALASPLLPRLRSWGAYETMNGAAGYLSIAFSIGVAIVIGASVLGRDLAERRLGFYFSRPLTSGAIWGGKMLGAFLLALVSAALVSLPVIMVGGGVPELLMEKVEPLADLPVFALLFFLLVFLVGLSSAISVAFRARSKWLILEVLAVPLLVLSAGLILWSFKRDGAKELFKITTGIFAITLVLAFLAAGAIAIATGRSEILRVHRGSAISIVALIASLAATLAGYSRWVHSASVDDLQHVFAGDPLGSWVPVVGFSPGRADYPSGFLVNGETGEAQSLRGNIDGELLCAADGSRAGWIEENSRNPFEGEVVLADLGAHLQIRRTRISVRSRGTSGPHFSDDGARFALIEHLSGESAHAVMVTVYDAVSEHMITSVRIPHERNGSFYLASFPGERMLFLTGERAKGQTRLSRTIVELDIRSKRLTTTGTFETRWSFVPDNGTNMVAKLENPTEIRILRASDGSLIGSISEAVGEKLLWGRFVSSGVAVTVRRDHRIRLDLYDASIQFRHSLDLGKHKSVTLGYEPTPGKLIVWPRDDSPAPMLVDLDSGASRALDPSLRPVGSIFAPPSPGSLETKIFVSNDRVIYFDPISGEQRVLAGKKPYKLGDIASRKE